jgi:hypothetical protein
MTSESESNVEVKNEGAQKEVNAKKDMSEVRESRKVRAAGKRRGRKASGSNSTTNITSAPPVKVATKEQQQVSKRLLTKLNKHESALQEISSSIKLLNSKRFRKKLDSIDILIKEVKVLDRRLKKVEKLISRLKRR